MGKTPGGWQLNVESLCELIHRATAESDDWAHADADREYAEDLLDDLLPGLGRFVGRLPHGQTEAQRLGLTG